jgi:hypothetical protein
LRSSHIDDSVQSPFAEKGFVSTVTDLGRKSAR